MNYIHASVPRRRGRVLPILIAAGVILLLAFLAGCSHAPEEEPPVTFQYNGRILTPLEGAPVCPYDPNSFSVDEQGRKHYRQGFAEAITGMDVSYYQGDIDWNAVAGDGISYVFLRLGYRGYTEGNLFLDKNFESYYEGATAAGLKIGVYFYSQAITTEEAEAEADFVLSTLAGRPLSYPIAYDWENITSGDAARTDGLDGATLTACAIAFCNRIAEGGYQPAVYLNQDQAYMQYDLRQLTDYPLWLADYRSQTDFYYDYDYWQYTHTANVAGVQTTVDLNLDLTGVKGTVADGNESGAESLPD